jgi:hypothetical protein
MADSLVRARRLLLACMAAALLASGDAAAGAAAQSAAARASFAAEIAALSEPGGYFDTDNLISNERSYLLVLPELARVRPGGAYIGVGPDQNFSYIAAVRPAVAFIIDIRRDNLLLHLLFKALFAEARTRVDYLSLLMGRAAPAADAGRWRDAPLDAVLEHVAAAPPADAGSLSARRDRLVRTLTGFGVPLSPADLDTMARFHQRFISEGLFLKFNSTGRPPQSSYPTYGDLLRERDPAGRQGSFLASEEAFQFVKSLHADDAIVPVVGDLSGAHALRAIGARLAARGQRVSAFYASNVEFYLFRDRSFPQFVENLASLPRADDALLIRSVFGGGQAPPGYGSTSLTQPIAELVEGFAAGRFRQYWELTAR